MKTLNQYIQEKLIINKDYHDNMIVVKSFDELRKIIEDRYNKLGPGTEQDPIDFNDIDVSNLDSFCNDKNKGIFESTKFKYIDISDWDVSNVKTMRSMFSWCTELKSIRDISKWDVSNVTDMSCMFFYCQLLKSVGDLSGWDVSKVTNMSSMFYNCKALKTVGDISDWDVSKVTNMHAMFCLYKYFNQDLSSWDVSSVTDKSCMFLDCPLKEEYKPKFK